MLENRRKSTRVPLQTKVICTAASRTIRGVIWNLSQGGMQVDAGELRACMKLFNVTLPDEIVSARFI
jgi:hypothetical protein